MMELAKERTISFDRRDLAAFFSIAAPSPVLLELTY